eukprot:2520038-Pyramimonas_sp.AAC.1
MVKAWLHILPALMRERVTFQAAWTNCVEAMKAAVHPWGKLPRFSRMGGTLSSPGSERTPYGDTYNLVPDEAPPERAYFYLEVVSGLTQAGNSTF